MLRASARPVAPLLYSVRQTIMRVSTADDGRYNTGAADTTAFTHIYILSMPTASKPWCATGLEFMLKSTLTPTEANTQ